MGWNHRRKKIVENLEEVEVVLRLRKVDLSGPDQSRFGVPGFLGGSWNVQYRTPTAVSATFHVEPCAEMWMDFYLNGRKFLSKKAKQSVEIKALKALDPSLDFGNKKQASPTRTITCTMAEILTCDDNTIRELAKEILETFKNETGSSSNSS